MGARARNRMHGREQGYANLLTCAPTSSGLRSSSKIRDWPDSARSRSIGRWQRWNGPVLRWAFAERGGSPQAHFRRPRSKEGPTAEIECAREVHGGGFVRDSSKMNLYHCAGAAAKR